MPMTTIATTTTKNHINKDKGDKNNSNGDNNSNDDDKNNMTATVTTKGHWQNNITLIEDATMKTKTTIKCQSNEALMMTTTTI